MPRRDFSKVAFAATGDTNSIPTPTQPDGSVSLQQGFTFDYQRDNGAGGGTPDPLAKNIDREDMNGILNEITASVGEIQQNGYPAWVSTAAPYPIEAYVRHNNVVYKSNVSNNSVEPAPGVTEWSKASLPSGALISIQRFLASGVYTATAGTKSVIVQVQAAGGAGGGAAATGAGAMSIGSGGTAGAYGETRLTSGFSGVTITVGVGGSPNSGTNGNAGGQSSFGSFLVAPGGAGGIRVGPASPGTAGTGAPAGGLSTGGNILNSAGAPGGWAFSATATSQFGGIGGASFMGGGGTINTTGVAPSAAVSPGSGGAGASQGPSAGALPGAAGASGIVIVKEYA